MSRAFVIERDEWFTCFIMNRNCKHANLRGDCTLNKCVYEQIMKSVMREMNTIGD